MTSPVSAAVQAPLSATQIGPEREAELRQVAEDLEASFLAEMLKHSGLGSARSEFGGGYGEEQFSSFLRNEQARAFAARGGVGLAESLFNALVRRETSQ